MLMGNYDRNIMIGQPSLYTGSDLEAMSIPYGAGFDTEELDYGLDPELGLILDRIEDYYTSNGLDGLGEIGFIHKKIKKAVSKVVKKVQARVKKDFKKIEKLRRKITPKVLIKMENRVLKQVNKIKAKADAFRAKITPSFLRKLEKKVGLKIPGMDVKITRNLASGLMQQISVPPLLDKAARKIRGKITPSFVRKIENKIARTAPRGLAVPRKKFVGWLKKANPPLFKVVMHDANLRERVQAGLDTGSVLNIARTGGPIPYRPGTGIVPESMLRRGIGVPPKVFATIEGLGAEGETSIWDNIVSAVTTVVPAYFAAKQQRDVYNLQLARAEKGLEPLDVGQIAPQIRTSVEMGPETRAGLQKMIIPLGIGAAALAAFFMMKK